MPSMLSLNNQLVTSQSIIRVLNLSQSLSALSFSSFLLLHLSAPIMATLAPRNKAESFASGFMVLGRVYYQEGLENVIIWGSLAVHISSGVVNRYVKAYERKLRRLDRRERIRKELLNTIDDLEDTSGYSETAKVVNKDTESVFVFDVGEEEQMEMEERNPIEIDESISSTPPPSLPFLGIFTTHHLTGYALIPFVLHHSWLHRLLPASSSPPYNSLSPTLLSYALVGYSLSTQSYILTTLSAVSYGVVLSVGSFHALSGIRRLIDPTAPIGLKPRRRHVDDDEGGKSMRSLKTREGKWELSWVLLVGCASVGVVRLALEGHTVPKWLGKKYDILLRSAFGLSDSIVTI